MHIERFSQLADALERDALGVAFCFGAMRSSIELALSESDLFERHIIREKLTKGLGGGDICCGIGGYAVQLFQPDYPFDECIFIGPWAQECLTRATLRLLRPPWIDKGPRWDCGHDLFSVTNVPLDCSTAQTAQSVRRLIVSEESWPLHLD